MRHLRYFVWLVVPLGLWLGYKAYGLPHVIWSYTWLDQGQGYNPFAHRWYTKCIFIGPYGSVTTHPGNGRCGWVVLAQASDAEAFE